ncbi:MAG TPA: TonB-dependent receptor [Bryobacteraceae bacterium]|nr:TonB-dependent receptor [Bryobacteraceae bacterium]
MSAGYSGLQNAGSQFSTTLDHSLEGIISKTIDKHTLKAGGQLYVMKANNITPVSNVNAFSFSAGFTQQNALSGSANAGNLFASLLFGWPSGGGVSYNIASAFQQIYYGFFVQDDWRVSSRLTLNLGLRWDYESPMSERYNRQNDGFALTATNPLQAQVPGLTLDGGLLFTSASNRLPFVRDLNNWQPRIGAAYRLFDHTVLRGGFATMYSVTFQTGGSNGFSSTTSYVASTNNNLTPTNGLSNPFPGGILPPTGSSLGLATLLGQGFTFADPARTIPKVYQYSLALQQLLPKQTLLEVAFAGNYATQMSVSKGINALPGQYYALPGSPIPVPSTTLLAQVPNPMAGLLPGSSLNSTTTADQNLLVPYPEFGGLTESTVPIGQSVYNSMQVSVEKRLSSGLQGRLSFTWDKIMQEMGYLNNQDAFSQLARAQASEPSKLLTLSLTYDLPLFAHTKGFLHNVFGGWEANAIMRYVNGYLISQPAGGVYPVATLHPEHAQRRAARHPLRGPDHRGLLALQELPDPREIQRAVSSQCLQPG